MANAVLDLCAFVVREGWEHREDEGDYPRRLAQKALAEADALRAHVKKAEHQRDATRADERAAVVAWLRASNKSRDYDLSTAIERGKHEVDEPDQCTACGALIIGAHGCQGVPGDEEP